MSAGAFTAGLLEGLWLSIWETLTGLKDAVVMVWDVIVSIFKGTILTDLKNLWEALKNLPEAIQAGIESFKKSWNQVSPVKRRQFRGEVAGRIVGEIALIALTARCLTTYYLMGIAENRRPGFGRCQACLLRHAPG